MFNIDALISAGATPKHIEFARFVLSNLGERPFPDYPKLDLMEIPRLVPNVWVLDFRDGVDDGFQVLFTGTAIDDQAGRNVVGSTLEEHLAGQNTGQVLTAYRSVYEHKHAVYTERSDYYQHADSNYARRIKTMLFPCSSDGVVINYGIGLSIFEQTRTGELAAPLIVQF